MKPYEIGLVAALAVLPASPAAVAATDMAELPQTTRKVQAPVSQTLAPKPNIRVDAVWLGNGPEDPFGNLDRAPRVGEWVPMVCSVKVTGSPTAAWKMSWFVDGQEFCQFGDFLAPPPCQFEWPASAIGDEAAMYFEAKAPGSHSFRCVVDVTGVVSESSEADNAKGMTFEVVSPRDTKRFHRLLQTAIPRIPQLRRLR